MAVWQSLFIRHNQRLNEQLEGITGCTMPAFFCAPRPAASRRHAAPPAAAHVQSYPVRPVFRPRRGLRPPSERQTANISGACALFAALMKRRVPFAALPLSG